MSVPWYEHTVEQCDVPEDRRSAPAEYRQSRRECLRGDSDTSVRNQVLDLTWHTAFNLGSTGNGRGLPTLVVLAGMLLAGSATTADDERMLGAPWPPSPPDQSVEVSFKPPVDHVEDPELARKNGLFKAYVLKLQGQLVSAFTVAFWRNDLEPPQSLEAFIAEDIALVKGRLPATTVARVEFEEEISRKFRKQGIECRSYRFESDSIDREGNRTFASSIVLFFRTREGIWSVSWSAPGFVIKEGSSLFANFVDDMRVRVKKAKR